MRNVTARDVRTLLTAALFVGAATSGALAQALPAPWNATDIGSPAVAGSAVSASGTFTVDAAGTDIAGTSDQFHYVYRPVTGDADIVARVASLTNTNADAKAGVMFREALTPGARYTMMLLTAANGYKFMRRPTSGGSTVYTTGQAATAPGWIKVTRRGDLFVSYYSSNGTTWTGLAAETIPIGATIYVGLAVTSRNATTRTRAVFDNVSLVTSGGNQPPAVTLTQPASGTQVSSPSTVTIAASASDPENSMLAVDFYVEGTMIASDNSAPYSASWSATSTGTYSLTAVAHDSGGASSTSSPVTVTVSSANGPPTVSLTSPAGGASFAAAATIPLAANASDPEGQLARVEFFSGSTQLAVDTTSPYSFSWPNVPAGTYSLTARAYDTAGASTTSAPVSVTVTSGSGGGTLPSPWTSADVGSPAVQGTASYASGTFTIDAAGADIDGTSDQMHFVYRAVTGDGEIVARVASLANTHTWAKAGVMFRDALTGPGRYAMTLITPSNGYRFQRRPTTGGSTIYTGGPAGAAPGWVKVVRTGDTFVGYSSTDGVTWTGIGAETIPMGATVYVGIAVTSRKPTTLTRAIVSNVTTTFSGGNQPPAVSITAPPAGAQFTAPATVTINANASDPENRMSSVRFYVEGTLIATDTAAPYSASWSASTPGTYSLTAIAYDADGGQSTSSPVSVTVTGANRPPTVSLTSLSNGAAFTAPATITLAANASDPENQVARVEFFAGTTRLATDTSAPYSFSWSNASAGNYTLTAVAYDGAGASATSAAVTVTVSSSSSSTPKSVVFTASTDHATSVSSYLLKVFTQGANPNTATPVASSDLGKPAPAANNDITVDRAAFFSALPAGNYLATVTAIGPGGQTPSSSVSFVR
jgi:regulation of enolase protein 1 (concanavalin A-like superfamily)